MDVLKVSDKLATLKDFDDLSDELYKRCVMFARSNFYSMEIVVDFILKNEQETEKVFRILRALKNDATAKVR